MDAFIEQFKGKTVLLAGCGGGYDVFGSLLLYFRLIPVAKSVLLTNFSFVGRESADQAVREGHGKQLSKFGYCFSSYPEGLATRFFPEGQLAMTIKHEVHAILIHEDPALEEILEAYETILKQSGPVDAIFLVDGGCDVLMTGCEEGLGTPVEDMMNLAAIHALPGIPSDNKYLVVVGADVDCAHGIMHQDLESRMQVLAPSLVLSHVLSIADSGVRDYERAVLNCQPQHSIVQSLVLAAVNGHRGLFTPPHLVSRIGENIVPLTERLCTMFIYPLRQIYGDVLYMDQITLAMKPDTVDDIISEFHYDLLHGPLV